jgi:hypothetical protein
MRSWGEFIARGRAGADAWGDSVSAQRHRDAEEEEKKRGCMDGGKKG